MSHTHPTILPFNQNELWKKLDHVRVQWVRDVTEDLALKIEAKELMEKIMVAAKEELDVRLEALKLVQEVKTDATPNEIKQDSERLKQDVKEYYAPMMQQYMRNLVMVEREVEVLKAQQMVDEAQLKIDEARILRDVMPYLSKLALEGQKVYTPPHTPTDVTHPTMMPSPPFNQTCMAESRAAHKELLDAYHKVLAAYHKVAEVAAYDKEHRIEQKMERTNVQMVTGMVQMEAVEAKLKEIEANIKEAETNYTMCVPDSVLGCFEFEVCGLTCFAKSSSATHIFAAWTDEKKAAILRGDVGGRKRRRGTYTSKEGSDAWASAVQLDALCTSVRGRRSGPIDA
jgi:Txe/YoeB family toxin of Txe-Axe toxin-antitoxin module